MPDRGSVNEYLCRSGLPAAACASLDRLAKRDPDIALEQAKLAVDARSRGPQSSAPRARRPVAEIVAGAVAEGRIAATSAPYWSERMISAPAETERLLTAPADQGGLVAMRVPDAPIISAAAEQADHERAFAAQFPRQAAALGYDPRRASPFTVQVRTPVHRPGRTPVQHIRDGS